MILDAIEWLGHSSFRLTAGGTSIYIDPYGVDEGCSADVILVTHGHREHFSPPDVERLSHEGTCLVAPPPVVERARGRVMSVAPGDVVEVGGVEVTAVAAYNTSKRDPSGSPFHPPEAGWVGYDINVRGERVYHSGDTDVIPEMDAVTGVDVALLPVSGAQVMTPAEAAEAARRIEPAVAVPMHWGAHVGTHDDAVAFADRAPVDVRIMERTV